MSSRLIDGVEVDGNDQVFLFLHSGLGKDLAAGSCDETLSPEFDAVATVGFFKSHSVDCNDVTTIRNRVGAWKSVV